MPRWRRSNSVPAGDPLPADAAGTAMAARQDMAPADYDAILRRTVDTIYYICFAVLLDADAADDAMGDVLEKLVKHLPKADINDVDRWLWKVAKNTALDHFRARKRRRESQGPLLEAEAVEDPSPTPEDLALHEALGQDLRKYLASLSTEQRQVVELRTARLTSKEVAEVLGRNPGWVDTTYWRALQKLRERLAADAEGRGER